MWFPRRVWQVSLARVNPEVLSRSFTREIKRAAEQHHEEILIRRRRAHLLSPTSLFGVDGAVKNITAVYTRGENGAPGNAVHLTKYDPQSQTWGLGTRLAMRDMDTTEEAEANSWSASETAAAWYDTNDDGKADTKDAPSSFTFNRLRVGLAERISR